MASILEYCDAETQTRLMKGLTPFLLKSNRPDILRSIRSKIILFDDLAKANNAGIILLLKYVSIQDLAVSLIGASEAVVTKVAQCMSRNMFDDLKTEISIHKNASKREIEIARERVIREVKQLIHENRLYFEGPDERIIN